MLKAVEKKWGHGQPDSAVVWLHGLGANGHDFADVVPMLGLSETRCTKFIFPHAPMRPVTLNAGMVMPAWFDIAELGGQGAVDWEGLESAVAQIDSIFDSLVEQGIPRERIVLVGFSQGGALALYMGLTHIEPLAGIMGLSTYIPDIAGQKLSPTVTQVPFWMAHGKQDDIVHYEWGLRSYELLKQHGVQCEWESYSMGHTVCVEQLKAMGRWISERLA